MLFRSNAAQNLDPLAGAFPELAALSDEDVEWAKQQWERGLVGQMELLTKHDDAP